MKLYAPKEYWTTPKDEREKLVNGCGPGGWKGKYIPDHLLGIKITEACDIHDWMYSQGVTEEDREEADRVFLNNMLRIVEERSTFFAFKWVRRRMALDYYGSVRDFGAIYFWAGKNEPGTFMECCEGVA